MPLKYETRGKNRCYDLIRYPFVLLLPRFLSPTRQHWTDCPLQFSLSLPFASTRISSNSPFFQTPHIFWSSSISSYCFLCPGAPAPSFPVTFLLHLWYLQDLDQMHFPPPTMCSHTICFPLAVRHQNTSAPPLWSPYHPIILCGWVIVPPNLPISVDISGW